MLIHIDSKDLHLIADEIQYNCTRLSFTDAEDAEDDLSYFLPIIQRLADDLHALANLKVRQGHNRGRNT